MSEPLTFDYPLTPQISVRTTVSDAGRAVADLEILSGGVSAWAGTVMQQSTVALVGEKLELGDATIEEGATFTLTIPTARQQGSVRMRGVMRSAGNPTQINANVAQWRLDQQAVVGAAASGG